MQVYSFIVLCPWPLGPLTDDRGTVDGRPIPQRVRYAVLGVGFQRIVGRARRGPFQRAPRRFSPSQRRAVPLQSQEDPSGSAASRDRVPVHDSSTVVHYLRKTVGLNRIDIIRGLPYRYWAPNICGLGRYTHVRKNVSIFPEKLLQTLS